jgi:hypothetical protein
VRLEESLARQQPRVLPRERRRRQVRSTQLPVREDDTLGGDRPLALPRGWHAAVSIMSSNGVKIQEICDVGQGGAEVRT